MNFKFYRGAGGSDRFAGRGTIVMIRLDDEGNRTAWGLTIAVDPNDRGSYEVGESYPNISMSDESWVEMKRNELWHFRGTIGAAMLFAYSSMI